MRVCGRRTKQLGVRASCAEDCLAAHTRTARRRIVAGVKAWPSFEDRVACRQFHLRMAVALAFLALTIGFAVIGAVILFTLSAVVTVGYSYEVVRFCTARQRFDV